MSNMGAGSLVCNTTPELQSSDFCGPLPTLWEGNVHHIWMEHTKIFQWQICTDLPGTRLDLMFASFPVLYNRSINLYHGIKNCITMKWALLWMQCLDSLWFQHLQVYYRAKQTNTMRMFSRSTISWGNWFMSVRSIQTVSLKSKEAKQNQYSHLRCCQCWHLNSGILEYVVNSYWFMCKDH